MAPTSGSLITPLQERLRCFRVRPGAWLALILLFAAAIRTPGLNDSAYYDEIYTLHGMDAPSYAEFHALHAQFDPPATLIPLYFELAYSWLRLTGYSVFHARLFSYICGLALIPLIYALGRRLANARTGLLAALFLAMSPQAAYYAVEVRMYALMMALCAASMLAFLHALDNDRIRSWLICFGVNALLLWTHLFAVFFLPVQGLALLLEYRRRRPMAIWFGGHALLLVLLAAWVACRWTPDVPENALWFTRPPLTQLANAFIVLAGGRCTNWSPAEHMPGGLSLDIPLALLLYASAAYAMWRMPRTSVNTPTRRGALLAFLWMIIPPLALFTASWTIRPLFVYRYVLPSSAPLYLLAAQGITSLPPRSLQRVFTVAAITLFAFQLLQFRTPLRPDYRSAASFIMAHGAGDEAIVAMKDYNAEALAFNSDISPTRIQVADGQQSLHDAVSSLSAGKGWVLIWRWDKLAEFEAFLKYNGFHFQLHPFGGEPSLWLYHIGAQSE